MKAKALMTVMIGVLCLLFLSTMAWAQMGGLVGCQNSLNVCTTNLNNAQTNLSTCQATVAQYIQNIHLPSWDKKLPCVSTSDCPRFEVLADWNNEAILDKETALVWEQSPSTESFSWELAQIHCNLLTTGSRLGWRLPTIQELASLVDRTQSNPALPSGHPFSNVQLDFYWSATTFAVTAEDAWVVFFYDGTVGSGFTKGNLFSAWCVRGGQGVDPQ